MRRYLVKRWPEFCALFGFLYYVFHMSFGMGTAGASKTILEYTAFLQGPLADLLPHIKSQKLQLKELGREDIIPIVAHLYVVYLLLFLLSSIPLVILKPRDYFEPIERFYKNLVMRKIFVTTRGILIIMALFCLYQLGFEEIDSECSKRGIRLCHNFHENIYRLFFPLFEYYAVSAALLMIYGFHLAKQSIPNPFFHNDR